MSMISMNKMSNSEDVPSLAAATPHDAENGAFSFQTPSPPQSRKRQQRAQSIDGILPTHYGRAKAFMTPGEKLSTALRRLQTRLSSPFYTPKRLEDSFEGYPYARRGSSMLLPCSVVTFLLIGLVYTRPWTRNPITNSSASLKFQFRQEPPAYSPSEDALNQFRTSYRSNDGGWIGLDDPLNPGLVFCLLDQNAEDDVDGGVIVSDSETRDFALGFEDYLVEHLTTVLHRMGVETFLHPLAEVSSYFSLKEFSPHVAESQYATPNGRSVLVKIRFSVPPRAKPQDYFNKVLDIIQRYGELHSPDFVDVTYTGLPLFQSALPTSINDISELDSVLPTLDAPCADAYRWLAERYGPGSISPYRIVFDGHKAGKHVNTKEAFATMHEVMEAFAQVDANVALIEEEIEEDLEMMMGVAAVNLDSIPQRTEDGHLQEHLSEVMDELYGEIGVIDKDKVLPVYGAHGQESFQSHRRTTYDGIAYLRNNPVPFPLILAGKLCLNKNKSRCPAELLQLLMEMEDRVTTSDGMTTYVEATLGVDPYSANGIEWLAEARKLLKDLSKAGKFDGFDVFIDGGATLEYDSIHKASPSRCPHFLIVGGIVLLVLLGFLSKTSPLISTWIRGHAKANQYNKSV